jgi:hypothetical protein
MGESATNPDLVTNNYRYLNKAIDLEVDRYRKIGDYYTSRRFVYLSIVVVLVCLSLLSLVAAYKLFQTPVWERFTQTVTTGGADSQALEQIFEASDIGVSDDPFISTSFTIFTRSLIETGEYVVTGATYQPEDLDVPFEQYCYLEHSTASGVLSAENLAYVSEGQVNYETDDKFLRGIGESNCRFVNTDSINPALR